MSAARPHLLLVDDAPEMGMIVDRYCRRAGWELTACGDAAEAEGRLLTEGRPDLLLVDLKLPGVGGVELCRRLRGRPATAGLWIALYSQWGTTGDIPAGLDAGADFVVAKNLAARQEPWTRRVAEILRRTHGRTRRRPVAWQGKVPEGIRLADDWPGLLARALGHASLRPLGPDGLAWVVRRGLADVFGSAPPGWAVLLQDGAGRGEAAPAPRPTEVAGVAAALAVRVWCLLGAEAGAAVLDGLRAAVPGL